MLKLEKIQVKEDIFKMNEDGTPDKSIKFFSRDKEYKVVSILEYKGKHKVLLVNDMDIYDYLDISWVKPIKAHK
ncbi:MAG: hypothetical protein PHP82_04375 [Candidatus ainarchaeum sp.]|nr:hypothetical protein [Candidatus ainarchaeum sp.]